MTSGEQRGKWSERLFSSLVPLLLASEREVRVRAWEWDVYRGRREFAPKISGNGASAGGGGVGPGD